jgi:carboxypeptidase C (cathepsin A)
MADNDYIVVTAISTHRMRYVMHKDDLRKCNAWEDPTDRQLVEWAQDTVTMQECEEFSQEWLGEQIVDHFECTEDEMLGFFDRDNDYLKGWSTDYKIEWVRKNLKT